MKSQYRVIILMVVHGLIIFGFMMSFGGVQAQQPISVEVTPRSASLLVGDKVEFSAVLHNDGTEIIPSLVAHLAIASLVSDVYVDPEDWSSARTLYLGSLAPDESIEVSWNVRVLSEGEFAVFVTLISEDTSLETMAGSPLLIHSGPRDILPLSQVLPLVVMIPSILLALFVIGFAYDIMKRRIPQ